MDDLLTNYPLLQTLFIGIGAGFGIYKAFDKITDIVIFVKTDLAEKIETHDKDIKIILTRLEGKVERGK